MSSNLSNELSSLRTTVLTAKDDIELIRNIYEPDALATVLGSAKEAGFMDVEHALLLLMQLMQLLLENHSLHSRNDWSRKSQPNRSIKPKLLLS